MAIEDTCWECGKWFVKEGRNYNQKYCCKECSEIADKKNRAMYDARRRQKKYEKEKVEPALSIPDMVSLMMELSEEYGRYIQYGELRTMIDAGIIKPKGRCQ